MYHGCSEQPKIDFEDGLVVSMEKNVSDKLIGSLAIFKSGLVERDFISSYIPFVATSLLSTSNAGETVNIEHVSNHFEDLFGFCIDRAPMTTILNKCAKNGLISKRNDGTFVIDKEGCKQKAISEGKVASQKEKYEEVISRLIGFYKKQYEISISEDEAEKHFLNFLSENSAQTLIVDLKFVDEEYTTKQHSYIISMFIRWCCNNDKHIFGLIMDLAMGYLMSSALAYDTGYDERTQEDAFCNLVIYFDTPFLLRVLGLNDEAMQEAALSMLEQLREMKALFKIFAHTYDETERILKDCLRWIEDENYDESHASMALRTFVKRSFTKADVQEYIDTLDAKLKYYGISIDENDYYVGCYYSNCVDETLIKESIIDAYKKSNFMFDLKQKESTIDCDVRSISAILKLRGKKTARTYRQARYVLLTTNTTLAFVTRHYLKDENPSDRYSVYPCITDVYLGTNIWLGAPVKKIENFSEKKLMADCMSMIQPSERLISTVQDYINKAFRDKTITSNQYYLLKRKAFDNDYLMNHTLGDETKFTDKIIEERLEEIERDIKAPLENDNRDLLASLAESQAANAMLDSQVTAYREREEQDEERNRKLMQLAENNVKRAVDVMIVGIGIPLLSFICGISGVLPFSRTVKAWLTVISGLLAFTFAILVLAIKYNLAKCKDRLIREVYRRKKIREYKRSLILQTKEERRNDTQK